MAVDKGPEGLTISQLVSDAHGNAVDKGFWDAPRETGTLIALVHGEVAEALDAETCAEFCEELSDVLIRIADLCGGLNVDLERAVALAARRIEAEKYEGFKIDTSSIHAIERSMDDFLLVSNSYKLACSVHGSLSKALEADRHNDAEKFLLHIGYAFMNVVVWANDSGYWLEKSILEKMARNKERSRLHGKAY